MVDCGLAAPGATARLLLSLNSAGPPASGGGKVTVSSTSISPAIGSRLIRNSWWTSPAGSGTCESVARAKAGCAAAVEDRQHSKAAGRNWGNVRMRRSKSIQAEQFHRRGVLPVADVDSRGAETPIIPNLLEPPLMRKHAEQAAGMDEYHGAGPGQTSAGSLAKFR